VIDPEVLGVFPDNVTVNQALRSRASSAPASGNS
jgi:hypothetical protein